MRRLILMRHSKTVASVPAGDHARHLSPRGLTEAAAAAVRMGEWGAIDFALVSDARRTRETFDRIVATRGIASEHRFEPRLYGATPDQILACIGETPASVNCLLIIGHNPGIGDLARHLSREGGTARGDLDSHFPTSAFAIIAVSAPDWASAGRGGVLELFATPHDP